MLGVKELNSKTMLNRLNACLQGSELLLYTCTYFVVVTQTFVVAVSAEREGGEGRIGALI